MLGPLRRGAGAGPAADAGRGVGFFGPVAIVFVPVGFGGLLGATSGLATFFGLALLAGFVFFDDGLCGAFGLTAERPAAALWAFLTSFFLLGVVFFLLTAFFAGMARSLQDPSKRGGDYTELSQQRKGIAFN